MLVDRDLEVPAQHFPLNYPHYAHARILLNPSSHVTCLADDHRGGAGLLLDPVHQQQAKFLRYLRYLLQRRRSRWAMLATDHAWMTLDGTSLTVFISKECEDGLQFRMGGYILDEKANLQLYVL